MARTRSTKAIPKTTAYGFQGQLQPFVPSAKAIDRLRAAFKSFSGGFSSPAAAPNWFNNYGYGTPWGYNWGGYFTGSNLDWVKEAGKLTQSTIVMATVNFLATAFHDADLEVVKRGSGGDIGIDDHPLTALIAEPNPYYDDSVLWMSTLLSYNTDGNAYWLKWRSAGGDVVQLWYEPHFTIRPVWDRDDPNVFIKGYQVLRNNRWINVDAENVVHFRWMLDPENPRKGMNPLASAWPEVFADKAGANFSAVTLRNMGAPSMVISPANEEDELNPDDMERIKGEIEYATGGDNKGRPLISPRAVNVVPWSWNPAQLNLRDLRKIPEERISALLRVPAVVVGLGAGLDRSTYSNVDQAKQQAYEGNLVPTWRLFGSQLTRSFRDDFKIPPGTRVSFNTSKVRILQDDWNKKAATIGGLFQKNVLTLDQVLTALDFDPVGGEDGKKRYYMMAAGGVGGGGLPVAQVTAEDLAKQEGVAPPKLPANAAPTPSASQGNETPAANKPIPAVPGKKSFETRVMEQLVYRLRQIPVAPDEEDEGEGDG
jgi:HK97 family phage portal protein